MALDPRLGRHSETEPIRPTKTLSGQDFNADNNLPEHGLGHGWYVALDIWAPRDFDVNAELETVKALIPAVSDPAVQKAVEKAKSANG